MSTPCVSKCDFSNPKSVEKLVEAVSSSERRVLRKQLEPGEGRGIGTVVYWCTSRPVGVPSKGNPVNQQMSKWWKNPMIFCFCWYKVPNVKSIMTG